MGNCLQKKCSKCGVPSTYHKNRNENNCRIHDNLEGKCKRCYNNYNCYHTFS